MSLDPTRDEWLAAHRKIHLRIGHITAARVIVEAILGACPPEPEPPRWHHGTLTLGPAVASEVWVGPASGHEMVTPDEVDALAAALAEHAAYAREQDNEENALDAADDAGVFTRPG